MTCLRPLARHSGSFTATENDGQARVILVNMFDHVFWQTLPEDGKKNRHTTSVFLIGLLPGIGQFGMNCINRLDYLI